ncbi:Cytochrome P450 76C4 [Acorus gramineus]|uniref:Cytochrome P450 76C4 n=1 Tax=Acorus gramineus TaxID=55184 RepID=A0AAV9A2G1_ACOGR|nr:Cytochrome P450 76C4 [Acorus gramineus]
MITISDASQEIVTASTDTTSPTVEWAMAELMRNPKELSKLQFEINGVVGKESDI